MLDAVPTVEILISGRVQGVGFRAYVQRLAEGLAIDGEVWNCRGGEVAALASHPDADILDRFVRECEDGPGRVDAIRCEPSVEQVPRGFQIGWTR